jgi:MFS family permease
MLGTNHYAGILTAIPYGLVSDRYGRKVVLGLSLLGATLGIVWYDMICKLIPYGHFL